MKRISRINLMIPAAIVLMAGLDACNRSTYPCPEIHGGTEVVKAGSPESMKAPDVDLDANGRLEKKPYTHGGVKKKRRPK
jgi:hypothetical protein